MRLLYYWDLKVTSFVTFIGKPKILNIHINLAYCLTYHKGGQPMIHQVDTRKQVFAALIRKKILPKIQDFGGEFLTRDAPKTSR